MMFEFDEHYEKSPVTSHQSPDLDETERLLYISPTIKLVSPDGRYVEEVWASAKSVIRLLKQAGYREVKDK